MALTKRLIRTGNCQLTNSGNTAATVGSPVGGYSLRQKSKMEKIRIWEKKERTAVLSLLSRREVYHVNSSVKGQKNSTNDYQFFGNQIESVSKGGEKRQQQLIRQKYKKKMEKLMFY